MRTNEEQEDRIKYLEEKLQECGHLGSSASAPFSAPPDRVVFDEVPRSRGAVTRLRGVNPWAHSTTTVEVTGGPAE